MWVCTLEGRLKVSVKGGVVVDNGRVPAQQRQGAGQRQVRHSANDHVRQEADSTVVLTSWIQAEPARQVGTVQVSIGSIETGRIIRAEGLWA